MQAFPLLPQVFDLGQQIMCSHNIGIEAEAEQNNTVLQGHVSPETFHSYDQSKLSASTLVSWLVYRFISVVFVCMFSDTEMKTEKNTGLMQ